jgi:hypothetical protein
MQSRYGSETGRCYLAITNRAEKLRGGSQLGVTILLFLFGLELACVQLRGGRY